MDRSSPGGTAVASAVSVTDRDGLSSFFAEVATEFGSLDSVVNTAGILRTARLPAATEDDWRAVLEDMGPAAAFLASEDTADFATALETLIPVVLGPAQEQQRTTGGPSPRLGAVFDQPAADRAPGPGPQGNCVIISDNAGLAGELGAAACRSGLTATGVGARRSCAALAQLARSANDTPADGLIDVFSIGLESAVPSDYPHVAQLAARMATTEDGRTLRGAEVFAGRGWLGLGSHPAPAATVTFGRPACRPGSVTPCGRR